MGGGVGLALENDGKEGGVGEGGGGFVKTTLSQSALQFMPSLEVWDLLWVARPQRLLREAGMRFWNCHDSYHFMYLICLAASLRMYRQPEATKSAADCPSDLGQEENRSY